MLPADARKGPHSPSLPKTNFIIFNKFQALRLGKTRDRVSIALLYHTWRYLALFSVRYCLKEKVSISRTFSQGCRASPVNRRCPAFERLRAAPMITVMVSRRREKRINIRLDRLYFLCFFFELHTFIIEPLLLFKKSLLFRLQRLQARQFFIALHGK